MKKTKVQKIGQRIREEYDMGLIYEEESGILRGGFFDVQNEVGLGKQERGYQEACELWLQENGVPYRRKPPHHIRLRGQIVHTLFPDLVVWDKITVELKAFRRHLQNSDKVQLFDYLKFRQDRLGLLVNMGLARVEVERVPYEQPLYELQENWEHWAGRISGDERETGSEIRSGLQYIFDQHSTGYSEPIIKDLILFELKARNLRFVESPKAKSVYRGVVVDDAPLDCLVVEGRVLLIYSALLEDNNINIARGRSYMEAVGLKWGIAINFGKKIAQINGLHTGS